MFRFFAWIIATLIRNGAGRAAVTFPILSCNYFDFVCLLSVQFEFKFGNMNFNHRPFTGNAAAIVVVIVIAAAITNCDGKRARAHITDRKSSSQFQIWISRLPEDCEPSRMGSSGSDQSQTADLSSAICHRTSHGRRGMHWPDIVCATSEKHPTAAHQHEWMERYWLQLPDRRQRKCLRRSWMGQDGCTCTELQ